MTKKLLPPTTSSSPSKNNPKTDNSNQNKKSTGIKKPKKDTKDTGKTKKKTYVKDKKTLTEIEALKLPPHMTSWDITSNPYQLETNIITLYTKKGPATYAELTVENFENLMSTLNNHILLLGDTTITGWSLRTPEDTDLPTLLSFSSNGAIVGTIPLEKPVLKELVPALLKLYNPTKGNNGGFTGWAKKHYILSAIGAIVITVITVTSIINVFF